MGRLLGFIYGGVPWLEIEEAVSFLDHIQMQELFFGMEDTISLVADFG